jgi:predicted alpha/beta hydrolase
LQTVDFTLLTADNHRLAATRFEPTEPNGLSILINSATGAPRHYYRSFAQYLAQRGCLVLTYDYRGIGDSIDPHFDLNQLRLRDWGQKDLSAMLNWLHHYAPEHKIAALGHSIGGQLIGLASNNYLIKSVLTVASQIGYWRNWPTASKRLQMGLVTGLALPAAVKGFGKLPGFAMGGVSLPAGIALEWSRWCRHPQYFVDEHGQPLRTYFERFSGPARFYAIADDHFYAPATAVKALSRRYVAADGEVVWRHPSHWGAREMGHFGYFRRNAPQAAWDEIGDWLIRRTLQQHPASQRWAA